MSPHKYHAKATVIDGIRFASKAEAAYYSELRLLEKAGQVKGLALQPKYPLHVAGVKVGTYIADFSFAYHDGATWGDCVVDVKGFDLPFAKWKRRHCEAQYGIKIVLVRR